MYLLYKVALVPVVLLLQSASLMSYPSVCGTLAPVSYCIRLPYCLWYTCSRQLVSSSHSVRDTSRLVYLMPLLPWSCISQSIYTDYRYPLARFSYHLCHRYLCPHDSMKCQRRVVYGPARSDNPRGRPSDWLVTELAHWGLWEIVGTEVSIA